MSPQDIGEQLQTLKQQYEKLTPGQKADLRRVPRQELDMVPAFYRLQVPPSDQWKRVVHFLTQLKSSAENDDSLGTALAKAKIHERRLFQMARSESPADLDALRRLLQQEPPVSWQALGKAIFFWGDRQKRSILKDFFLAQTQENSK
ncbi:MAG: type I-E CRISPR-associated protein Cse2/CasB [Candidatus Competibacteraceae bacterium]|nr:type I-E CRISPR-associated protein Cse2/CasB [Candidatus Competibacteraceae bacterium]MCB1814539.1 type I-E CRISPR-associated protein Cse2/CasB [Candidatus Competibacteraceae bacterium]